MRFRLLRATTLLVPLAALGLAGLGAGCGESKPSKPAPRSGDSKGSLGAAKGAPAAALMEAKPRLRAAPGPRAGDVFMAKMNGLIEQACKCKDRACAMKTLGDLSALKTKYARVRLRHGQNAKLQAKSVRFGRCLGSRGVKPDEIMKALQ